MSPDRRGDDVGNLRRKVALGQRVGPCRHLVDAARNSASTGIAPLHYQRTLRTDGPAEQRDEEPHGLVGRGSAGEEVGEGEGGEFSWTIVPAPSAVESTILRWRHVGHDHEAMATLDPFMGLDNNHHAPPPAVWWATGTRVQRRP